MAGTSEAGPGGGVSRPAAAGSDRGATRVLPRTLTVLGCDGSYPGPGGAASGYLVRAATTTLWLDAGPGTFAHLQQVCDPRTVDAVVLSHEHPDHWTDLESFAVWRRRHDRSTAGPRLCPARPAGSARTSPTSPGWPGKRSGRRTRVTVGELRCSFVATDHGPPTLAVRIDPESAVGGDLSCSLAYSADTGPDWSLEELGTRHRHRALRGDLHRGPTRAPSAT